LAFQTNMLLPQVRAVGRQLVLDTGEPFTQRRLFTLELTPLVAQIFGLAQRPSRRVQAARLLPQRRQVVLGRIRDGEPVRRHRRADANAEALGQLGIEVTALALYPLDILARLGHLGVGFAPLFARFAQQPARLVELPAEIHLLYLGGVLRG